MDILSSHDPRRPRPSGWGRVSLALLATPLLILSCGTAPQVQSSLVEPESNINTLTSPQAYFHFLSGYLMELTNDFAGAIAEYRHGLTHDPDSVFLKVRIAKLYVSNSEMAAAVEAADQVPLTDVAAISDLLQLGKIYAGTGHSDRALAFFGRAIEQAPDQADAYISKGMLLLSLKHMTEAQEAFREASKSVPQSPESHYYLGVIASEEGRVNDAVQELERAIQLRSTYHRAYSSLASVYEEQGTRDKAIQLWQQYLEDVNPHHKDVRLQLVHLYLRDRSYDQAIQELQRIAENHPDDLNVRVRVALIYGEMKQHQKAIDELMNILQARPNELRVRDYLGRMYEETKNYDQAIQSYQANLAIDPTYYDSLLHLGYLAYRMKDYDQAIAHLGQAKQSNPTRPELYLLLGLTHIQQEEYQLASVQFKEGIQQDPKNADLHFNLGTVYDKLNQFDSVVQEMEQTLTLEPEHADALNYLGYSYADRGIRVDRALELTQQAVALKPNNGYYIDSLGWALFKLGRSDEALETINRALSIVSDDPVIFEHLGDIYLQRQELEEAQKAWAHSIALDSSNQQLIQRFRDQGFGEPALKDSPQQDLPKVSHSSPNQLVSP